MKYGMKIFGVLMIAHWLEHIFQAYQVYVMHMDRACALGMLGMKYPWLIRTESLHYFFALLTSIGFIVAGWHYFESRFVIKLWTAGAAASLWHLFEHTLLFGQALSHRYLFGAHQPISIIQLFVPRIELHLFYNSIITVFMVWALIEESMYLNAKKFKQDHHEDTCEFCE
jgi:hypothetical protein